MAGLLDIFGGGGGGADDPYADILTPAQRNHMQAQGLLAMAGALAQAGMPSRLPVPFGSALGAAAAALGTGQEAGMKTAIENALAAQKVRDLRSLSAYRQKTLGDLDPTSPLSRAINAILAPGGTAAPVASPSGGVTPQAGAVAGPGAGAGGGGLLSPDLSLGSDYASGLAPEPTERTSRFNVGLLDYPADQGGMRIGGRLLAEQPDAGLGTATPSSAYAPGGSLYPFKDLGVVPGGGGGGATPAATSGGASPNAETQIPGAYYDATEGLKVPGMPGYDPARAGRAPPPVTPTPGPTNGIDPRRRAALDAILGGMQTAQGGPSAGRLPQFAGPGAADAAAADTVPEGGGLLGVAPDLRAPIEANPFARSPSPGDPRGVAPLIRQGALRYGVDPDVALKVARSEGLGVFSGDYGKSGSAFQLYTGGGLGNEFQKQTGLDPLDPKNEPAAIDWALRNVNRTGWGPYHGAAKVGIGPRTGLPGGDLPPDEVIPSGPAAGGRPPVMQAQYAPGGGAGGAPMPAAPGAGALPTMPQVPVPPGADPAKMNALILELARRNAASEVLGLGNPYNSLLTVLQGSPQYKAAVEAATETARRGAGLPFVQTEAREKALGGYEVDVATRTAQANLDRVTKQIEQMGAAANALAPNGILVPDGQGGQKRIQATVAQALRSANGLGVPELGIPPMKKSPGDGGGAAPDTPVGESVLTPGQTTSQQRGAEAGWKALTDTHAAEMAANRSDQQLGQIAQAMQGFTPGATAELRLRGGQILKDLGFKVDGVSDGEILQQAQRRLQVQAANVHEGSVSNYERSLFAEGVQQLTNSPEGIAQAINIQQRLNAYDKQVAAIHRDVMTNGVPNLVEAQRRIANLGPPLSPGEISALEQIRAGKVPSPGAGGAAEQIPPGSKPIGTYQGKPVYQMPDGSRKVLQ